MPPSFLTEILSGPSSYPGSPLPPMKPNSLGCTFSQTYLFIHHRLIVTPSVNSYTIGTIIECRFALCQTLV